jgi:hypothetical protein
MGISPNNAETYFHVMKDFDYGTVRGMALTSYDYHFSEGYVVAVLDESNNLRIVTWQSIDPTPLGISSIRHSEPADKVAIAKVTGRSFVTPIKDSDGNLRVILWTISSDGKIINRVSHLTGPEIIEVTATEANGAALIAARRPNGQVFTVMAFLEGSTLMLSDEHNLNNANSLALSVGATNIFARRNKDGNLHLTQILHNGGFEQSSAASVTAGAIQETDVTAIDSGLGGHWVTISGHNGTSKLIEWNKTNGIPGEFSRHAELEISPNIGGTIQGVVKSLPTGRLVTGQVGAYRNCEDAEYDQDFCAQIRIWDLDSDGFQQLKNQTFLGHFTQIEIAEISKAPFHDRFVVAFVEADGNLKITVWGYMAQLN